MKAHLIFLTVSAFFLYLLSSCELKSNNKHVQQSLAAIDSSNYAVLKFDTNDTWLFDDATPSNLEQSEIEEIDSILKLCIDTFNINQQLHFNRISNSHPDYNLKVDDFIVNLSRYRRQYFPVINSEGHKEVWVNCFCNDFDKNWRNEMLIVFDGGNCYFNLIINLTTKTFYRFMVNGDA